MSTETGGRGLGRQQVLSGGKLAGEVGMNIPFVIRNLDFFPLGVGSYRGILSRNWACDASYLFLGRFSHYPLIYLMKNVRAGFVTLAL